MNNNDIVYKPLIELRCVLTESLINTEKALTLLLSNIGFDEEHYGNVLVAVSEAVTNAIEHGNAFDDKKGVKISYSLSDNAMSIKIDDDGAGFDFNNIPNPTALENIENERGRGVYLIRNLSDHAEFHNNGSTVILSFNRI